MSPTSRRPRARALKALLVTGVAAAALAGPSAGSALAAQIDIAPGATVVEGDGGQKMLEFDVSLSGTVNPFVAYTADWQTIPAGSATPRVDYLPVSGSVRLSGAQHQKIAVPVIGDTDVEQDETVEVELFNPQPTDDPNGAPIVGPRMFGTIVNDDVNAPAAPAGPDRTVAPATPTVTTLSPAGAPAASHTGAPAPDVAADDVGPAMGMTFHGMRKKLKVTLRCPSDERTCAGRLQVRLFEQAMKTVFFRLRGSQSKSLAIPMTRTQRHTLRDAGNFYLKAIATDQAGNRFARELNFQL